MRVLWLLPKAAPAVLRHIAAYFELAAYDLEQARRGFTAILIASVVAGACVFFAVLMGCVVIVALTWDTPYRVAAVACSSGVFLIGAVIALIYRSRAMKEQPPFLATLKREWREDAVVLDRILADDDKASDEAS
jgi:uncharacterized membrane protein YqjE